MVAGSMDLHEYALGLEDVIEASVAYCNNPHNWDEDYITRRILDGFKDDLATVTKLTTDTELQIRWSAYKQDKKQWGDVGILIDIKYEDGSSLQGGAVLEAKKKEQGTIRFDAIKEDQQTAIQGKAPHAMMLLYDYEQITKFGESSLMRPGWHQYWPLKSTTFTHAVACPISSSRATGWKNTSLYRISVPFSYQLCYRYFGGLDLDFGEELVKLLRGDVELGAPKYLLVFSLAHGRVEPNSEIQPNRNLYAPLKSADS